MEALKKDTGEKLQRLEEWFKEQPGSIVAFSGGIDSSLLLFLARKWQGRQAAIGVISDSESLKRKDFQLAKSFSKQFDIILELIETRELEDERYNQNPVDRCYFCKEHLYTDLKTISSKYPGFPVLNGTNADDYGDYRPGMKAAVEYEVRAPLADCGITKTEIREMARFFGLPNWNKPASPCLSSRIPYAHSITRKKLAEIEEAEDLLNSFGFEDVRVRHYGDHGKIEVRSEELPRLLEMKEMLEEKIREIGFPAVVIDEEGLVSGKLNRSIKLKK
ncbi:MAG: ATP-dependent sacrificial sulfur transferase LarE [Bacteroidales bacterium]|nr:ATP-dependent sacrificial sulfur transferase LarE [Bacteroidales bacterium]